jgi:hypothetical protein
MDPPYGGRPTSLWTHQSLLRWQDPREVSQSHSPPLDHTYVFSQGWKMKSHGFMGPQGANSMWKNFNSTYTSLWHVDQAPHKRRQPQRTICKLVDLQEWANTLHLSSMTCGTTSRRSRVAPPAIGRSTDLPRWSSNLHRHLHDAMHTSTCSIALNHWSNGGLIQRQQEDITRITDVALE